ncbi:fibrinogen alpha chain-like [Brachyistius frenatus]|uniref:fibrinogen alpha chain-like n=1 Tax=Brachyistius frenatus TaxID=100188 RepID=UPI0037E96B8B
MERLSLLVCLVCLVCVSSTPGVVDPRGVRPVEHGTRSEKCASEKEWPFCTDDEWGPKCPSGCRIQGLMDKYDHSLLRRVERIRSLLNQNEAKHRSTDVVSKQTYDYLKDKLTTDAGHNNNYYDLAQSLRQRITEMKIKIDRQVRLLAALKDRVKDQVVEMQRLEVDIDIKLRSCKGSCASYSEHQVDHESYVALDKQIDQLDSRSAQNIESVGTLYVMKSRPLQGVVVDSIYKSGDVDGRVSAQQKEDVFPEVKTVSLVLEEEGSSSSSPATISKDPGTSYSPSSSSSSSSFSSSSSSSSFTPSRSITELGGRGDGDGFGGGFGGGLGGGFGGGFGGQPSMSHTSTSSTSCTKSIRRTIVHTKDGPVERTEEVIEGGPECQGLTDVSRGSMGSLFPSLTHTSHSSGATKTSHVGGAKGSIMGDSKTGFGNPFDVTGLDLGGFLTDNVEDDVPDFHARSVKSTRVERQADYVGKDCVEAFQNHLKGETNGPFKIKPGGADSTGVVEVYCQQEGLMGGWLLVQQRESGAFSFNRTWNEYRDGFGSVDARGKGEVWLGNQNLHLLTSRGETLLRVELEDWEGGVATAEYTMRVGAEQDEYRLQVSGYAGDAGDALVTPDSPHSGMKFSTLDRDNDESGESCAEMFGGGWWYNSCQTANLNGIYYKGTYNPKTTSPYEVENGVVWPTYKPASYSLKAVRMLIRPAAF